MNNIEIWTIIVDVITVISIVLCIVISYKNGVIYEFVNLFLLIISCFASYLISPILAKRFYLLKPELIDNPLINSDSIYFSINVVAWFVILTIVFCLVILLIKPIFKKLTKIPIIGWINKLFGIVFGVIKSIFVCFLISSILSMSFVKDGKAIKEKSILKYTNLYSNKIINVVINNIDYSHIEEEVQDFDINSTREFFENWLIESGFIDE